MLTVVIWVEVGLCFITCVCLYFYNFSTGDLKYLCNWKIFFFFFKQDGIHAE